MNAPATETPPQRVVPEAGQTAPDVTLPDETGAVHHLSDRLRRQARTQPRQIVRPPRNDADVGFVALVAAASDRQRNQRHPGIGFAGWRGRYRVVRRGNQ